MVRGLHTSIPELECKVLLKDHKQALISVSAGVCDYKGFVHGDYPQDALGQRMCSPSLLGGSADSGFLHLPLAATSSCPGSWIPPLETKSMLCFLHKQQTFSSVSLVINKMWE